MSVSTLPLPVHTVDDTGADVTVRTADSTDAAAVERITQNTWPDRAEDDYVGSVFPEWVAADDGETAQTVVITVNSQPHPDDPDSRQNSTNVVGVAHFQKRKHGYKGSASRPHIAVEGLLQSLFKHSVLLHVRWIPQ